MEITVKVFFAIAIIGTVLQGCRQPSYSTRLLAILRNLMVVMGAIFLLLVMLTLFESPTLDIVELVLMVMCFGFFAVLFEAFRYRLQTRSAHHPPQG